MSMSEDREQEEWRDRQAIQSLIHRYSSSITRGDYDQTATVFAPDAVWEEVGGDRHENAQEFMDALVEGSANLDVLIQTAHNPVVQLLGAGRAKATTTIHEIARGVVAIGSSLRRRLHRRGLRNGDQLRPVWHVLRRTRQARRRMEVHSSRLHAILHHKRRGWRCNWESPAASTKVGAYHQP